MYDEAAPWNAKCVLEEIYSLCGFCSLATCVSRAGSVFVLHRSRREASRRGEWSAHKSGTLTADQGSRPASCVRPGYGDLKHFKLLHNFKG